MEKTGAELFDDAVLGGNATWWQMKLPSGDVIFGDEKTAMIGNPDGPFTHYKHFMDRVHPDDYEKAMNAMRSHLAGSAEFYETTYRIRHKNGSYILFFDCGRIVKKEGDKLTIYGFVHKLDPNGDIDAQTENFKKIVTHGSPSMIELVSKIIK